MIVMTILPSWRSICRLLIGVLMLTQLAIAAHACAGLSRMDMPARDRNADAAVTMAGSGMVGMSTPDLGAAADQGDGMDPKLSNLCVAHCQYGPQSADHAQALAMPAVLATYLYTLPPLGEVAVNAGLPPGPGRPPAAAEPPHAILHCCWRI
ncbi:hypothetical protein [Variovorax sp. MHTC-1]|uniref:hypothetical protein n=1 Tax=Variovorax sp. MHTC-1 TaxID=2495593 RepID=UPI00163CC7EB|nr:hypothetical protein [Variovorax sp. MHTC-1]